MPTNEPLQNFEIPALGDSPDVPTWIANIVRDLIGIAIPRYASTAARDLAIPTPADGQECVTGSGVNTVVWIGVSGAWRPLITGRALLEGWTPISSFGPSMGANTFGVSPRIKAFDDGFIRMAGGVRALTGNIPNGGVLFTLPNGYFPPAYVEVSCATNADSTSSTVRVEIRGDGTVRPMWSGSRTITWISLDSVQWWKNA